MRNIFFLFAFSALLASCNLEKEVDIELPDYARQPVVECYLEPGKPFRLLLSRSYSFFDKFGLDSTFLQKTIIQGATVSISYNGRTIALPNTFAFEPEPLKIFNYSSPEIVPATPGIEYTLNIQLPDGGGSITGKTMMINPVPIDSVVTEANPRVDTLFRALTYITDDLRTTNYYRRLLNYKSLDSLPQQDFLVNDRFSTEPSIAFGTGYDLKLGDTLYNTIFHLNKEYYDYIESYQLAIVGNLNPFAQPSRIRSNVTGTSNPLGIFTALVYDRDTTIVK
jgi:Domain of unknown function (DUF4249)